MNTLSLTTSLLTHSLAWALLYSLWQGLLVYGTLYVLLKALPNINARAKYYLSFGSLTALFLWFADTWLTEYQKLKGVTVYITQPAAGAAASTTYAVKTISSEHLQSPLVHHFLPGIEYYFPLIILIYSIGLSFMLFRFLVNVMQVKALRTQGVMQPEQHWNDYISYWREQLDIARPIKLFLSDRVNVPMMLGVFKPVILLPIATMNHLSTEQVEAILLHELAHIRRHDYLLNILQTIAETMLFFNPFVWLISGITRREREHCCDDMVISCNASPLLYAKALAMLEDNRIHHNQLVLAATGHKNQLFHRIKRIMEMKKSNINYAQLTIAIVAIIAITLTVAMFTFTPSFAQNKTRTDGGDTTIKKKSVYKYKSVTIDSNGKRTEIVKESPGPIKGKRIVEDKDDDGSNVNVSVIVNDDGNDDKNDNNTAPKAYSYSYSYSDKDGDDLGKAIKEITIAATQTALDAVASIDIKEIEKELENAQKEINDVDWDEIRSEIRHGLKEVDKELDDAKLNKEISIEVKRSLEKSKEALENAEKEIKTVKRIHVAPPAPPAPPTAIVAPAPPAPPQGNNYESMLDKMERDGLIDRSQKYTIKKEDGELYINGEKQPDAVYSKYHHYLKDKSVSIKGHKGSLSISINDD